MSTTTTNIGLIKPAANDRVNLTDLNSNFDKLDTAIGALGTPSSNNNIKAKIDAESASSRFGQTTASGTSWNDVVNTIKASYMSTDALAAIAAEAEAIQTIANNNTIAPTNSYNNYDINTTFTLPSSGASATAVGVLLLIKKTSGSYFSGIFIPYSYSIPFYIRRYNNTKSIRLMI